MSKAKTLILLGILPLAGFLRFFQLSQLMTFIGDQGWFYLSARDMLLTGNIPLVGVASSHPWLHQGALWTYLVALLFGLSHFNPLVPGYFTAIVGVVMVWLVYKIASNIFSQRIGLIASFLYATSPFIILSDRMPYHTSLIPLFSLLYFYSLVKWVQGNKHYFPLTVLCLTILYNFELATASLWLSFFLVLGYGLYKKKPWTSNLKDKKIAILSFFAFTIPMLPMFIYDTSHGFPQTFGFGLWILYRIARVFGYPALHPEIPGNTLGEFLQFSLQEMQRLFFASNVFVALALFLLSASTVLYILFQKREKKTLLLSLWFFIPLAAYLAGKTTSEAYLPILFSSSMFVFAISVDYFLKKKYFIIPILGILGIIGIVNSYTLLSQNYFQEKGVTYVQRVAAAQKIVTIAGGKKYNLIGQGSGSQFASFTMNTAYLTWWLGNAPSEKKEQLRFTIKEDETGVRVSKM